MYFNFSSVLLDVYYEGFHGLSLGEENATSGIEPSWNTFGVTYNH